MLYARFLKYDVQSPAITKKTDGTALDAATAPTAANHV